MRWKGSESERGSGYGWRWRTGGQIAGDVEGVFREGGRGDRCGVVDGGWVCVKMEMGDGRRRGAKVRLGEDGGEAFGGGHG